MSLLNERLKYFSNGEKQSSSHSIREILCLFYHALDVLLISPWFQKFNSILRIKKPKKLKRKEKKQNLNLENKLQYNYTKFLDENIKISKTDRKPPGVGSESYHDFWNANA